MTRVHLFETGDNAPATPVGRVDLHSLLAAPGGGFVRATDEDGNATPFSYACEPRGLLNEDEAREVAAALQRGTLQGRLRSYDWRLAQERADGGEVVKFLVVRASQRGHHRDLPPCPEARWETVGAESCWVVELRALSELTRFQERYGRLTLGRAPASGLPTLEILDRNQD
jgi:hypothetical protein